jgi:hypothetical protein
MWWQLYLWTCLRARYLVWSCIRWFIGMLPDMPRDYTVWSTLEPSRVDSRTWAAVIQVGSATRTDRATLCQLARKQELWDVVPLSPSLVLKHSTQHLNHGVSIGMIILLLQIRGHGGKHETADIEWVIAVLLISCSSCSLLRQGVHQGMVAQEHNPFSLAWEQFLGLKRPPIREDLKVLLYQSQEADNTFITSDGTSPYNSSR